MSDARTRAAERAQRHGVGHLRELLRSQDSPCGECGGHERRWNTTLSVPSATNQANTAQSVTWVHSPQHVMAHETDAGSSIESAAALVACRSCAGTGLRLRPLVELAAYCGDEGARGALGGEPDWWAGMGGLPMALEAVGDGREATGIAVRGPDHVSFSRWLRGLSRWGPRVLVRAATAAARVALEWIVPTHHEPGNDDERLHGRCWDALRAIEAAEAWVECPCEEHLKQWRAACVNAPRWVPYPDWRWGSIETGAPMGGDDSHEPSTLSPRERIGDCAQLAGEAPVREAIQRALIAWARAGL